MSHLVWIHGQIALTYSRSDGTTDDLDEWLSATDRWDAWVKYRVGLTTAAASVAAYAYAIFTASSPALSRLDLVVRVWLPLGLLLVALVIHW